MFIRERLSGRFQKVIFTPLILSGTLWSLYLIPTITSSSCPVCEDTSEDIWVPSVRHVACNQSDSRLVWSLCHWPKRLKQSWVFKNFIRPHQCPAIIYQRQSLQSLITHKIHSSLFSKGLSHPSVKVNLWFINQHRLNTVQTCNEIMCGISVLIWAVLQPLLQFKLH